MLRIGLVATVAADLVFLGENLDGAGPGYFASLEQLNYVREVEVLE